MRQLLLILKKDINKYQHHEPCEVYTVPIYLDFKLEYMKLIIKTYIDIMSLEYEIIITETDSVNDSVEIDWFENCMNRVKNSLCKTT